MHGYTIQCKSFTVEKLHGCMIFLVIRRKTFAIVQQFETPYNRKEKIAGKPSRLEANP